MAGSERTQKEPGASEVSTEDLRKKLQEIADLSDDELEQVTGGAASRGVRPVPTVVA